MEGAVSSCLCRNIELDCAVSKTICAQLRWATYLGVFWAMGTAVEEMVM